jgi:WD40 repeat protein
MKSYPPGQPDPDTQIAKVDPEQAHRRQRPINSIAFSPDGKQMLTGSEDGFVQVWDRASGKVLQTFRAGGGVANLTKIAFSPDGKLAVSSCGLDADQCMPTLWSILDMRKIRTLRHSDSGGAKCITFSPDGKWIADCGCAGDVVPLPRSESGYGLSSNAEVRLWNVSTDEAARTLCRSPGGEAQNVSFSPDSKFLLAAGGAGCSWGLKIWDVATGAEVHAMNIKDDYRYAIFLPKKDEVLFATGSQSTLTTVKISEAKEELRLPHQGGMVEDIAVSPNGKLALSIEAPDVFRSIISIWTIDSGKDVRTIACGHIVSSARFSPEGADVVGFIDGKLCSWDIETGEVIVEYKD